jgi:hypothetical protein
MRAGCPCPLWQGPGGGGHFDSTITMVNFGQDLPYMSILYGCTTLD